MDYVDNPLVLTAFAVLFPLYVFSILDCATQERHTDFHLAWLLIVIFVPTGFLFYLLFRRRTRRARHRARLLARHRRHLMERSGRDSAAETTGHSSTLHARPT